MTKVFLDTNIILDYILSRESATVSAEQAFQASIDGEIECYVAAHSLTDVFYIVRHEYNIATRKLIINSLCSLCNIVAIDEKTIEAAINDKRFNDFEDALEMACAEKCEANLFLTRDKKGFKNSKIKIASHL